MKTSTTSFLVKTLTALACVASSSAGRAATPRHACPAIPGTDALLQPGAHIILGEMHGTQQIPRFVGDVACAAANLGAVRVGLEIPVEEQQRIDSFIASKGDDGARKALTLGSRFWSEPFQDGRRSQAVAALLESLRQLHQRGADLRVLAYDAGGADRDSSMAKQLLSAFAAEPTARFVVLSGNLHARKTAGQWKQRFMAAQLVEHGVKLTTLDAHYGMGSAWICGGPKPDNCGPGVIGSSTVTPATAFSIVVGASKDGAYDGHFEIGTPSFAPPAIVAPTTTQSERERLLKPLMEAQSAYDGKRYARCGELFGELALRDGARRGEHAYESACCYAQGGNAEQAFRQLTTSVDSGYANADWVEHDNDLTSLHGDKRWVPLLTRLRALKTTQPH